MKYYKLDLSLNLSTIRSLLKRFNKKKLTKEDKKRLRKWDIRFEQRIADLEIESVENKLNYWDV